LSYGDKSDANHLLGTAVSLARHCSRSPCEAAALSFDHLPARGWQALSGLIIVIGGGVLIVSPFDSIAILTLVAGSWLIAIGIVDVVTAFQVRHRLASHSPG